MQVMTSLKPVKLKCRLTHYCLKTICLSRQSIRNLCNQSLLLLLHPKSLQLKCRTTKRPGASRQLGLLRVLRKANKLLKTCLNDWRALIHSFTKSFKKWWCLLAIWTDSRTSNKLSKMKRKLWILRATHTMQRLKSMTWTLLHSESSLMSM